ncbi:hypothetical protein Lal_00043970 [Lupinus albus]|nr:hypothetical protein Lal_00043970 [Lupinus albus]
MLEWFLPICLKMKLKGVVELVSDYVVCEEGKPLSPEAARILLPFAGNQDGYISTSLDLQREIPDAPEMGKFEQQQEGEASDSSGIMCHGCSFLLPTFSFKCLFILFFTFSALFSSLFWILPNYTVKLSFDAKDQLKHSG